MKKIIISLLSFLIHITGAYTQSLVINININDCNSCYNNIINLDNEGIEIPRFAVMQEGLREDSAEVEKRYKFEKLGFRLIFNDLLHRQTLGEAHTTSLSYFNKDGVKEWARDLKRVDKAFVNDTLVPLKPESFSETYVRRHSQNYIYDFNYGLGTLKIRDRDQQLIGTIHSSDFPFDLLIQKLDPVSAYILEHKGMRYNTEDLLSSPKYLSFKTDKEENIYLFFAYLSIRDTIENLGDTYHCIVKYSKGGVLTDLYPIYEPAENRIFFEYFALTDGGSIMAITHDYRDWIREKAKRGETDFEFLSEFTLENGAFVFKKRLPHLLPKIYAVKYYESFLTMLNAVYPYISFPLANEILNVSTGRKGNIVHDSLFQSQVNYTAPQDFDNEPLHIYNSGLDKKGQLYIPYKWKGIWYLNTFDPEIRLLKSVNIHKLCPQLNIQYVLFDMEKHLIKIHCSQTKYVHSIPLSFL